MGFVQVGRSQIRVWKPAHLCLSYYFKDISVCGIGGVGHAIAICGVIGWIICFKEIGICGIGGVGHAITIYGVIGWIICFKDITVCWISGVRRAITICRVIGLMVDLNIGTVASTIDIYSCSEFSAGPRSMYWTLTVIHIPCCDGHITQWWKG